MVDRTSHGSTHSSLPPVVGCDSSPLAVLAIAVFTRYAHTTGSTGVRRFATHRRGMGLGALGGRVLPWLPTLIPAQCF